MGFQWDFSGISVGFQWDFSGISVGFQVGFQGIPRDSKGFQGISKGYPRDSKGFSEILIPSRLSPREFLKQAYDRDIMTFNRLFRDLV